MNFTHTILRLWAIILFTTLAAFTHSGLAQTLKWSYSIQVPAGYIAAFGIDTASNRSSVESINDGFGGSIWIVRLKPNTQNPIERLERVVWLSSAGVPQFTNDFALRVREGYGSDLDYYVPVRLVRVTRTDAILQQTIGFNREDGTTTNVLISLKKSRTGILRKDTALAFREGAGPVVTVNGAAGTKEFFTRQFVGDAFVNPTSVVIRRYSN